MSLKSFILKSLFFAFVACFACVMAYQIYASLKFDYDVTVVKSDVMEKKAEGVGVVFKDEFLLDDSGYVGMAKNNFSSGSRVAANSEVVRLYKSYDDISKFKKLEFLENELNFLKEAQNPGALQDMDIKSINKQMQSQYYGLERDLKNGNLEKVVDFKEKVTTLFNKRQIITGQVENFNDAIEKIVDETERLRRTISSQPKSIQTPVSGYFVDGIDGYESECAIKFLNDFDFERIEKVYQDSVENSLQDKIGKIITNPTLFLKVVLPTGLVADAKVGSSCRIKFEKTGEDISANLSELNINWNGEKSLAVFKINVMTEKLSKIRASKVEIIFNTYRGIKIPKTAVKTNSEGEVGVYALNHMLMKFKKIDVLFEDENSVICSDNYVNDATYLRAYDKIITRGRDLYDNKPVR